MKTDKIMEMAAIKAAPFDAVAIAATLHTMLHGDASSIRFWACPEGYDAYASVKAAHKRGLHDITDAAIIFESLPECFDKFLMPPTVLVEAVEAARIPA